MRKNWIILAALGLVAALVLAAGRSNDGSAQRKFGEKPTPIPADVLIPAPTPPDEREIAILSLRVISDEEGQLEAIELQQGRTLNSYAPNVLALSGPWTVELAGEEGTLRYGILDPRMVEIEGGEDYDMEAPYINIIETDIVWELVVPLYDGAKDLQVMQINIYDEKEALVFSTDVKGKGWMQEP
jgi:hypothetical protein